MPIQTSSGTKLTCDDLARMPPDGLRHELLDGHHLVNPSPVPYHQALSARLLVELFRQIEEEGRGQVFAAPLDVVLSRFDVVEPDLLVIAKDRCGIISETRVDGPPDLVVEILSPGTRDVDLGGKRELYRRSGVREYWVVDPEERVLVQAVLRGGEYALLGRHRAAVRSEAFPGVEVDLSRIW